MKKITPCLWFDDNAEDALNFYTAVFKNARVRDKMYYGDSGPGKKGSLLSVTFELEGQEFLALNGGPAFQFSPAISLFVQCETQEEIDYYWAKLLEGGSPQQCGWLTDKFGVSWQIVPRILGEMLRDKDAGKADRVMQALLKMVKLDIKALRQAYEEA